MDVNNEEDEAPEQGNLPPNEEDGDEIAVTKEGDVIVWQKVQSNFKDFDLTPRQPPGVSAVASNRWDTHSAFDFYSLFLDNDILDMLVNETKRYAEQCTVNAISKERRSNVLENWQDVTKDDSLTFLGLVLWMGLDK